MEELKLSSTKEKISKFRNNLNPKFATPVPLNYYFEETQPIRFLVLDIDDPKHKPDAYSKGKETIGYFVNAIQTDFKRKLLSVKLLAQNQAHLLEHSSKNLRDANLRHDGHPTRKNGNIFVRANEVGAENMFVRFRVTGHHLDKKDFFGKSGMCNTLF